MSYYRPSTLASTSTHAIPEASSSRLPLPPTIEEEEQPSGTAPIAAQGEKGKGKEKKVRKMTMEDVERLAGQICNVRPLGACQRPQSSGSLYCTNHSCQAINADGDRCGNWVSNPRDTRFCSNGWHMENSRHTHLSDLLAYRKALNARQSNEREKQNAAQLYYIEQRFPSSSSSSSASISSHSDLSLLMTPPPTSPAARSTRSLSEERGWGAHGVDAWWRGNWGLNSGQFSSDGEGCRRNSS
ncbi:hypothetical protein I302_105900 [Kwoniella bestiolae CBS 10118]|uniref:SCA7 domain-containing protein n=1 Tax=Kwoniella bestiolae CBS 10118 TaxID=1296100 RepID=A0A1B9G2F8_9TREE|nr:hypothetical protein I302_05025 [Kwoniella bestiolae CBS 10118]OCF25212.1 hypothetical protein I302_05025 [Kwoniella bestiolae CBS 10118]